MYRCEKGKGEGEHSPAGGVVFYACSNGWFVIKGKKKGRDVHSLTTLTSCWSEQS